MMTEQQLANLDYDIFLDYLEDRGEGTGILRLIFTGQIGCFQPSNFEADLDDGGGHFVDGHGCAYGSSVESARWDGVNVVDRGSGHCYSAHSAPGKGDSYYRYRSGYRTYFDFDVNEELPDMDPLHGL